MFIGKLELDWTQKPLGSIGAARFGSEYRGIVSKTEAIVTMENCDRTREWEYRPVWHYDDNDC